MTSKTTAERRAAKYYDLDFGASNAMNEVTPEQAHAAALTACEHAIDLDDARALLSHLGLLPTAPRGQRR